MILLVSPSVDCSDNLPTLGLSEWLYFSHFTCLQTFHSCPSESLITFYHSGRAPWNESSYCPYNLSPWAPWNKSSYTLSPWAPRNESSCILSTWASRNESSCILSPWAFCNESSYTLSLWASLSSFETLEYRCQGFETYWQESAVRKPCLNLA